MRSGLSPSLNPGPTAYSWPLWQKLLTLWMPARLSPPEASRTDSSPWTASHLSHQPARSSGLLLLARKCESSPSLAKGRWRGLTAPRESQWINASAPVYWWHSFKWMYPFSIAAVTNYHQLRGLKQQAFMIPQKSDRALTWLRSKCWQEELLSGGSRRKSAVSLPFPASRKLLFSFICGSFFHLHSWQRRAKSFPCGHLSGSLFRFSLPLLRTLNTSGPPR